MRSGARIPGPRRRSRPPGRHRRAAAAPVPVRAARRPAAGRRGEARPQPPAPAAAAFPGEARPRPYAAASRRAPGRAGPRRRAGPYWNRTRTAARAGGAGSAGAGPESGGLAGAGAVTIPGRPGRRASRRGPGGGVPPPGRGRDIRGGHRRARAAAHARPRPRRPAGRRGGRPPLPRGRHRARASERPHRRRGPGRRHTPARGAPRPGRRPGTPGPDPGTPRPGAPHPEVPGRERQPGTMARSPRIVRGRVPPQVLRRTQPPARPAAARTARSPGRPITWTRSPSWFRPGGPGRTERKTATRPGPARGPTRRGTAPQPARVTIGTIEVTVVPPAPPPAVAASPHPRGPPARRARTGTPPGAVRAAGSAPARPRPRSCPSTSRPSPTR